MRNKTTAKTEKFWRLGHGLVLLGLLFLTCRGSMRPEDDGPTETGDSAGANPNSMGGTPLKVASVTGPSDFQTADDFEALLTKNAGLKTYLDGLKLSKEITVQNPDSRKFYMYLEEKGKF